MDSQNKKGNHTTRFLLGSFSLLLLISAVAFLCLSFYMNSASEEAIIKMGNLYMTGINEQISTHFETLIDLKLEQAETVVDVVPVEMDSKEALYEELVYRTHIRNFNYLALCSEEGKLEMLYGEQISLFDPDPFYESLRKGEKKVAVGQDAAGNSIVLFGVNADYPMQNGESCTALIVALPLDYISTMLSTEEENVLMSSHIIREDGTFIASDLSDNYTDYFASLHERYAQDSPGKIELYVTELSTAMQNKEEYSVLLNFDGSSQQIYCNPLPYSEWHLVTVLPFGVLNETIDTLSQKRTTSTMLVNGTYGRPGTGTALP